jgi:hypothetical protein
VGRTSSRATSGHVNAVGSGEPRASSRRDHESADQRQATTPAPQGCGTGLRRNGARQRQADRPRPNSHGEPLTPGRQPLRRSGRGKSRPATAPPGGTDPTGTAPNAVVPNGTTTAVRLLQTGSYARPQRHTTGPPPMIAAEIRSYEGVAQRLSGKIASPPGRRPCEARVAIHAPLEDPMRYQPGS